MMHSLRKRQKRASDNMPSPPILPPLPALRDVSLDWVLKLSVRCERAAPGFMCHHDIPLRPRWQRPPDEQVSLEREEIYDDPQAYRDLVVSGRASAFDLVLAMLCAFGLETIDTAKKPYPRRSNEGSLQAAGSEGGPVKVSLRDGYATESGPVNGGILGLEYADTTGEVSMGALKQLRVAQLLDKPHASSKSRSSRQGVRKGGERGPVDAGAPRQPGQQRRPGQGEHAQGRCEARAPAPALQRVVGVAGVPPRHRRRAAP